MWLLGLPFQTCHHPRCQSLFLVLLDLASRGGGVEDPSQAGGGGGDDGGGVFFSKMAAPLVNILERLTLVLMFENQMWWPPV